MTRDPMTLQLYRQNKHIQPSPARDVADVLMGATLLLILLCIAVVAFAGCSTTDPFSLTTFVRMPDIDVGEVILPDSTEWTVARTKHDRWAYDIEFRATILWDADEGRYAI